METAINIGYACRVLTNDQRQCIISSEVAEIAAAEDKSLDVQEKVLRNQASLCFLANLFTSSYLGSAAGLSQQLILYINWTVGSLELSIFFLRFLSSLPALKHHQYISMPLQVVTLG